MSEVIHMVMEEMFLQLDCSTTDPDKASPFERTATSCCQNNMLS